MVPEPAAPVAAVPISPAPISLAAVELVLARLERLSDPAWLDFAIACERLMGVDIFRGDLAADGYSLDSAYAAYLAGLTPAHYAYATGRIDPRLAPPRLEGHTGHTGHTGDIGPPVAPPLFFDRGALAELPAPRAGIPAGIQAGSPAAVRAICTGTFGGVVAGAVLTALALVNPQMAEPALPPAAAATTTATTAAMASAAQLPGITEIAMARPRACDLRE